MNDPVLDADDPVLISTSTRVTSIHPVGAAVLTMCITAVFLAAYIFIPVILTGGSSANVGVDIFGDLLAYILIVSVTGVLGAIAATLFNLTGVPLTSSSGPRLQTESERELFDHVDRDTLENQPPAEGDEPLTGSEWVDEPWRTDNGPQTNPA